MSSNYFPMVSSSPPPFDEGPSVDDEDEFGNFTSSIAVCDDQSFCNPVNIESADVSSTEPVAPIQMKSESCRVFDKQEDSLGNNDDYDDFKSHYETISQSNSPKAENDRLNSEETVNGDKVTVSWLEQQPNIPSQGSDQCPVHLHNTLDAIPVEDLEEDVPKVTNREMDMITAVEPQEIPMSMHNGVVQESEECANNQVNETRTSSYQNSNECVVTKELSDVAGSSESVIEEDGDDNNEEKEVDNFETVASIPPELPDDVGTPVPKDGIMNQKPDDIVASTTPHNFAVEWTNTSQDDSWEYHGFEKFTTEESLGLESTNKIVCDQRDNPVSFDSNVISSEQVLSSDMLAENSQDEFSDFSSAAAPLEASQADIGHSPPLQNEVDRDGYTNNDNDNEDDDDFGNFATFSDANLEDPSVTIGWSSTFKENSFVYPTNREDDGDDDDDIDDEFKSFDSFRTITTDYTESWDSSAKTAEILTLAFPCMSSDPPSIPVELLDEELKKNWVKNGSKTNKGLWFQLCDIDNTHALTYHWNHSQTSKKLLQALHIESRNLLAGTKWSYYSMPLFAANLGADPLEPTKVPPFIASDVGGITSAVKPPLQTNVSSPQESVIPPAQFDWSSSGLVNPLDDSTSALLDLDFFLTNDAHSSFFSSSSSAKQNCLETEFLGLQQSSCVCSDGSMESTSSRQGVSPLLDKILSDAAKSYSSSYSQNRLKSSNLGAEARRILESLPDLSFMQAKVLMFPIRSTIP